MPWYLTEYETNYAPRWISDVKTGDTGTRINGELQPRARYGSWLWASDMRTAKRMAKLRGIGETIASEVKWRGKQTRASTLFRKRREAGEPQLMHALTWLGYLALKSGVATPEEVLGDTGIVHQAIHVLEFEGDGETVSPSFVYEGLRRLEERVPGFLSDRERR